MKVNGPTNKILLCIPKVAIPSSSLEVNKLHKIVDNQYDNITISNDGLEAQKKYKKHQEDEARRIEQELKRIKEEMEKTREKAEADAKMWKTISKCLTIAMRIMMGDIVPVQDEKFLMENDRELYSKAITLRTGIQSIKNKDPKKHKSILDENDLKNVTDFKSEVAQIKSEHNNGEIQNITQEL